MKSRSIKRYLLAFAATGNGHYYALQALAAEIRLSEPNSHVQMFDVFGQQDSMVKRIVEGGWHVMSTNRLLRPVYRLLYERLLASSSMTIAIRMLMFLFARHGIRHTFTEVDHYIALHPAAVPLGVMLKKSLGCRFSVFATDYVFHNLHCHELVDEYFVPRSFFAVGKAPEVAIQRGRVWHRQIPIDARFHNGSHACRPKESEVFRVLVSFGATGIRGVQSLPLIRRMVAETDERVHFTLIAGRNAELLKAFVALKDSCGTDERISVCGFVQNMAELMERSHLLVGKAGGLTVTEARQIGLPIAIVDTLPGQEDFNCDTVVSESAGVCTGSSFELVAFIDRLREPNEWLRWSRPEMSRVVPVVAVAPNTSLKRSANGMAPGPVWRYAVHFRESVPGAMPSSPA